MKQIKNTRAAKHDEMLAELESGLVVNEVDEAPAQIEEQTIEDETIVEESATPEQQTPSEEVESENEALTAETEGEDFSKEELDSFAEKSKRVYSKLRSENRELKEELEREKQRVESRKVLEDVREDLVEENALPWKQLEDPKVVAKRVYDEESRYASIGIDADWVENTYPEFRPGSTEYDEGLVKEVYSEFKDLFKANNTYRLRDVVNKRMSLVKRAQEEALQKVETQARVDRQRAQEAPPTNVTPPKKSTTVVDRIDRATSRRELEELEKDIGTSSRYR